LVAACGGREPHLDAVVPRDTARALTTAITVEGENLAAGARIHLVPSSGAAFVADAHVHPDGIEASAVIPSGLSAGAYDVLLENPDGRTARLAGAFTIYEGSLDITFLDVGQGDATFIRSPRGDTLLKDGGPFDTYESVLRPYLSQRGALPPTNMIVSHRHVDHMAGILAILEGPDGEPGTADDGRPAGVLLHNGPEPACNTNACRRYEAASRGIGRVARTGEIVDLGGGVSATVVAVNGELLGGGRVDHGGDENAASVAIVVDFGGLRVFVGGDLTGGGFGTPDLETPLAPRIAPIHVLRASHHGSATSTNVAFVQNLSPEDPGVEPRSLTAAVISAGRDNSYCHPHHSVVNRLYQANVRLFLTNPGITLPTADCAEQTWLPADAIVADGHVRLVSEDGRRYTLGPAGGEVVDFEVP
jgi:beta-lactamase superfamily II metal-dependent hydrolase